MIKKIINDPLLIKPINYIKLGGYVIIPVIFFILPADYFNSGETICLFTQLSGIKCWGCGMTRACMNIIHFQFEEAWMFNKLAFIVFPILSYAWLVGFIKELKTFAKIHHVKIPKII